MKLYNQLKTIAQQTSLEVWIGNIIALAAFTAMGVMVYMFCAVMTKGGF